MLAPKQMLQRLLIALAKVHGGNTSENLKSIKYYILCIKQMKLLKMYITM